MARAFYEKLSERYLNYYYAELGRERLKKLPPVATPLAGYVPAWLLCLAVYRAIGAMTLLPLHMTLPLTLISLGLTLGMCLLSAMLAIRRVIAADPAEIF